MSDRRPLSRTLADLRADPPPPAHGLWGRWLVPGELTVVAARAGIGKTTFTRSLMAHGARGGSYLEQPFARPLRWLYLSGEGSASFWFRKMTRAAEAVGLDPEAESRINVVAAGGDCSLKINRVEPREVIRAELARLRQGDGVDVLVLDPLARFMTGDENTSVDMGAAIDPLLDVLREFNVAGVVPHHAGKGGGSGLDALRGHTTLEGAVATALVLTTTDGNGRRLDPVKVRYAETTGDHKARFLRFIDDADLYVDEEPDEAPLTTRQQVLRILADGEWHLVRDLVDEIGVARQTLKGSHLDPLHAQEKVEFRSGDRGAISVRLLAKEEHLWAAE